MKTMEVKTTTIAEILISIDRGGLYRTNDRTSFNNLLDYVSEYEIGLELSIEFCQSADFKFVITKNN